MVAPNGAQFLQQAATTPLGSVDPLAVGVSGGAMFPPLRAAEPSPWQRRGVSPGADSVRPSSTTPYVLDPLDEDDTDSGKMLKNEEARADAPPAPAAALSEFQPRAASCPPMDWLRHGAHPSSAGAVTMFKALTETGGAGRSSGATAGRSSAASTPNNGGPVRTRHVQGKPKVPVRPATVMGFLNDQPRRERDARTPPGARSSSSLGPSRAAFPGEPASAGQSESFFGRGRAPSAAASVSITGGLASPPKSRSPPPRERTNGGELDFATPLIPEAWKELVETPAGGNVVDKKQVSTLRDRLSPASLQERGLGPQAVYRLYRALRVYSLGFHEVVYELCDPVHHRDALLHDVWQFFVSLWDGALRVAFDSEVHNMLVEQQRAQGQAAEAQSKQLQAESDLHTLQAAFDDLVKQSLVHSLERAKYSENISALNQAHGAALAEAALTTQQEMHTEHEAAYGALAEEMKVQEEKTSFAMEELVSLRQEHLGVQAEFQDLQKRYTVSQENLVKTEASLEAANASIQQLDRSKFELKGLLDLALTEAGDKKREYDYKEEEWRAMYRAFQYLKADLEVKKADIESRDMTIKQMLLETEDIRKDLDRLEKRVKQLTSDVERRDVIIFNQRTKIEELEASIVLKDNQIDTLQRTLEEERAANEDALVLKDAECAQAISQKEEQFRIGLVDAENKTALARQRQEVAEAAMKQYWSQLGQKRIKKKHWKSEHAVAIGCISELEAQIEATAEQTRLEMENLSSKNSALAQDLTALTSRLEGSGATSWMAEQKLNEDLRAAQQDLEEAQRILANQEIAFKKEIATLTERLADAQADKADAERSLSDATLHFESEMATMRLHIQSAEDQVTASQSALEAKEQREKELQEKTQSYEAAIQDMNKRSKLSGITFQAKIEELSEKITVEHSAAADSKEQHAKQKEEYHRMAAKLQQDMESEKQEAIKEAREHARVELNNLRDAIQTERTKLIESKDGQIESLKLQLEECQSEMKIIRLHKETTVLATPEESGGEDGQLHAPAPEDTDPDEEDAEPSSEAANHRRALRELHGKINILTNQIINLETQRDNALMLKEKTAERLVKEVNSAVTAATVNARIELEAELRAKDEALEELQAVLYKKEDDFAERIKPIQQEATRLGLERDEALGARDREADALVFTLDQLKEAKEAAKQMQAECTALELKCNETQAMLEEMQIVSSQRDTFVKAMGEILSEKTFQLQDTLKQCAVHATVKAELVKMQGEIVYELPADSFGPVATRCGYTEVPSDHHLDVLDKRWHTFQLHLKEEKMCVAMMNQQHTHMVEKIEVLTSRAQAAAQEMSEQKYEMQALEDTLSKVEFQASQATHQKFAIQELLTSSTSMLMGLLGIQKPGEDLVAKKNKNKSKQSLKMKEYSKLNLLQGKLDQITKATTVGGGIRQLEERLTDMTHRIHALAAKEEELISHIQESFVVYSAMTARLDEIRKQATELANQGTFFLKNRFAQDRSETHAAVARIGGLQAKVDQLREELAHSRGEIDKLTTALFSSAAAAEKGKMAIARVEAEMEQQRRKHRGELLLATNQFRVSAASSKSLKNASDKAREAAMQKCEAMEEQMEHYKSQITTHLKDLAERDSCIEEMKEKLAVQTKQIASQGQQLMHVMQQSRSKSSSRSRDSGSGRASNSRKPSSSGRSFENVDLNNLPADAAELHGTIKQLVAQHQQESDTLRREMRSLEKKNADLTEGAQRDQKEIQTLKAEVHRLSRRCAPALEQQWVRSVGGEVRGVAPNLQLQSVLVLISRIYLEKIAADTKDDEMKEQRQNLREFVYDFFLFKFGLQMYAEIHLYMLLKTLEHRNLDDPAVTLFGALCGASHSESMPLYAIHFYLHFLSKVYEATGGPSQDECVHGKTNVRLSVLAPIVQATLMDTLPNQEVADLQNAIRAKASEEADPRVDLGFASLELMRAWSAEDARRGQHLQLALADSDKNQDGVLSFEEFADVLTRVAPDTNARTLKKLWRAALNDSSNKGMNTIMPETLESVARDMGVGFAPYLLPQAVFTVSTVHNDILFFRDSWSLMSPIVLRLISQMRDGKIAIQSDALQEELNNLEVQVEELETLLASDANADATNNGWSLLRRILLAFAIQNQRLELSGHEGAHRVLGFSAYGQASTSWSLVDAQNGAGFEAVQQSILHEPFLGAELPEKLQT